MGEKVATERTVVKGPDGVDRVVAAGDPLSAAFPYIENAPNKVDAAANADVADAADQAAKNPEPPVRRVAGFDEPVGPPEQDGGPEIMGGKDAPLPPPHMPPGVDFDVSTATKAELFDFVEAQGLDVPDVTPKSKVGEIRKAVKRALDARA